MDGEKPPLLFTFLVTSGLYSVLQLDSEQYVNQLSCSGRPVRRIYHVSSRSCLYTSCPFYLIPGSKSCNRSVFLLITVYFRANHKNYNFLDCDWF